MVNPKVNMFTKCVNSEKEVGHSRVGVGGARVRAFFLIFFSFRKFVGE